MSVKMRIAYVMTDYVRGGLDALPDVAIFRPEIGGGFRRRNR